MVLSSYQLYFMQETYTAHRDMFTYCKRWSNHAKFPSFFLLLWDYDNHAHRFFTNKKNLPMFALVICFFSMSVLLDCHDKIAFWWYLYTILVIFFCFWRHGLLFCFARSKANFKMPHISINWKQSEWFDSIHREIWIQPIDWNERADWPAEGHTGLHDYCMSPPSDES